MAQYWYDYSADTLGAAAAGLTLRFDTANITHVVEEDAEGPAGRRLTVTRSTNGRSAFSLDALDSDPDRANADIRILVRVPSSAGASDVAYIGPMLRGSGAAGAENTYFPHLYRISATNRRRTYKYIAGSGSAISSPTTTAVWSFNTLHWLRLRQTDLAQIFDIAAGATPNTATYTLSSTDSGSTITDPGWVGFMLFKATTFHVLAIAVGTNGDEAPTSDPGAGNAALQGAAAASAAASGNLSTGIDLAGAGQGTATATGTLATGSDVQGAATAEALATGALTTGIPLDGDAAATATATGALNRIAVLHDVDAGNIDPTLVTITNPDSDTPTIWLDVRAATGSWRHFLFGLKNAAGKRPIFQINRATRSSSDTPATDYLPVWTQDWQTYTLAPSRTLSGGASGYIQWQFTDPLPDGVLYVMSQPTGRQADAVTFANELLTTYSAVAAPTASANASGVFATTPAETDDLGRAIGENPMFAFQLAWGGATTDGAPKRKLVMFAGIHSAGENTSWVPFRRFCDWILNDTSSAAVAFRANWNVHLYFNLTPNGIKGGHRRWNFRSSQDPNRDFKVSGASVLAEIGAVRAAAAADVGTCDCFLSWHAFASETRPFIPGKNDQNSPTATAKTLKFIAIGESFFGQTAVAYDSDNLNNTDAWWAEAVLGAKQSYHAENPQNGTTSLAFYQSIGENWAKTVTEADAQGLFYEAVDGAAAAESTATGELTTAIPLAGLAASIASTTGQITTAIPLAGSSAAVAIADGILTTSITLQGAALAQAVTAATFDGSIALAGAGQGASTASAALDTGIPLTAVAAALAAAAGVLTIEIRLNGAAVAQAAADADLGTTPAGLAGIATSTALASAALATGIPLHGEATASVGASGALGVPILLSGAAAGISSATGDLTLLIALEGHSLAAALAAGVLTTAIPLSGTAVAQAVAAGALFESQHAVPPGRLYRVPLENRILRVRP